MTVYRIKRGRAFFELAGPDATDFEREIRGFLGPVLDLMQDKARHILDTEVKTKWPVKTGKSLKGWTTSIQADTERAFVEVALANTARTKQGREYVKFIRSAKIGKKPDAVRIRNPLAVHVRKPAARARRALRREIPPMLAKRIEDIYAKGRGS